MKVLVLSPYPKEGASFRFRVLQYLPLLASQGIDCSVRSFLTSWEFARVHLPGNYAVKALALTSGTLRLGSALAQAEDFDVILVHRELHPLRLEIFERWLQRVKKPVILDVDDAIYLPQPHGNRWLRRPRNPQTMARLAAISRQVIVSNEYLGKWFRQHNSSVVVIPTVIDTQRFVPRGFLKPPGPLTIGWIGSPSTAFYLEPLLPVFRQLAQEYHVAFKVVGAGHNFKDSGVPLVRESWQLDMEVANFQSIDIGVYPLPNDPWALGKGGFKTIQYMAAGVPVVASPVGVNCEIIRDGENGFLASSEADWLMALRRLLSDALLRQQVGQQGRRTVVERYSVAAHGERLIACLREAAVRPSSSQPSMVMAG